MKTLNGVCTWHNNYFPVEIPVHQMYPLWFIHKGNPKGDEPWEEGALEGIKEAALEESQVNDFVAIKSNFDFNTNTCVGQRERSTTNIIVLNLGTIHPSTYVWL